jgi:hypothetical protein
MTGIFGTPVLHTSRDEDTVITLYTSPTHSSSSKPPDILSFSAFARHSYSAPTDVSHDDNYTSPGFLTIAEDLGRAVLLDTLLNSEDDSTDSEDLADSEDPNDPQDSAESENSIDSEDPTDSEDTVDSEDSIDLEVPTDSEDPVDLEDPIDSEDSTDSEDTTDPQDHTDSQAPPNSLDCKPCIRTDSSRRMQAMHEYIDYNRCVQALRENL